MAVTLRKYQIPFTGILGAGAGAAVGELGAETIARATAQTGWAKVGVKGAVKAGIGLLLYGISTRVPGLWSLFTEIAGYSSVGSIIPDVIYQITPGGLWGLAEGMAVSLRAWAVGAPRVRAEIGALSGSKTASRKVEASTWI